MTGLAEISSRMLAIQSQIARTRSEMSETIDAIQDKLSPETSGKFFHAHGQELPW